MLHKNLIRFILIFTLLMPVHSTVMAQDNSPSEETTQDDGSSSDKKKKKKNPDISEEDFFRLTVERLNYIFFLRLLIDVVTMIVLIGLIYYPNYNKKDFFFTF